MNDIFKVFLSLSVSGSIIALILLTLKPILKDRVGKAWQYYIWLAVIIRLLIPLSSEISITGRLFAKAESMAAIQLSHREAMEENIIITDKTFESENSIPTDAGDNILQPSIIPQKTASNYLNELISSIWLIWLVIAIMLFARKITSYNSFVRFIKAGITETADYTALAVFDAACHEAGLKKPLNIYTNKLAVSPMLVGIFRPFIVLPGTELGENELYNIFIHELTHYRRLDIFYKWLMQLTVCLHWYNPVVYLISREINKSCELSCDEAIIKGFDINEMRNYGDTLLASLKLNGSYGDAIASVTLNEDAKLLKERLGAIMKFKSKSKSMTVLSSFLTIAVLCGTLATGAYAAPSAGSKSTGGNPEITVSNTNAPVADVSKSLTDMIAEMPEIYNDADKAAIKIMEYSGSWEVTELLFPFMSNKGIDEAVKLYNDKNKYSDKGTKKPEDYYYIDSDTEDADARALAMMQCNGMWEYTKPMFPYMSNKGIDSVVNLYNQKHQHNVQKIASDYYNLSDASDVNEIFALSSKNGYNIVGSGMFQAKDGQILTLTITSTIRGGTVDFFIFDPTGNEQRITIGSSDITQEIELTAGQWLYNCSGIFKDGGDIEIIGTVN